MRSIRRSVLSVFAGRAPLGRGPGGTVLLFSLGVWLPVCAADPGGADAGARLTARERRPPP